MPPPLDVLVTPVDDFEALGALWRELETRADPSFFQSWTWTGCLAEARFPDPILVTAHHGPTVVGLGLFNRRRPGWGRSRLYLGETGDPARDSIFVEHNGFLLSRDAPADTTGAMLRALARNGARHVVLSGVDQATLLATRAAGARPYLRAARPSWVAAVGPGYLSRRSANTRQQINRSLRAYREAGAVSLDRAEDLATALAYFQAMAAAHQAGWRARGQPGAFAEPFFPRFHTALITRGLPLGEIALSRFVVDGRPIGFLYNFRHRGQTLSYQSGFDYADPDKRRHPGLTAHTLAIEAAARDGAEGYDLLAGDAQYKHMLADRYRSLFWIEARVEPGG